MARWMIPAKSIIPSIDWDVISNCIWITHKTSLCEERPLPRDVYNQALQCSAIVLVLLRAISHDSDANQIAILIQVAVEYLFAHEWHIVSLLPVEHKEELQGVSLELLLSV